VDYAHSRRNSGHSEWNIAKTECRYIAVIVPGIRLEGYDRRSNEKRCCERAGKESKGTQIAFLNRSHLSYRVDFQGFWMEVGVNSVAV
jgi:hypothetical protein